MATNNLRLRLTPSNPNRREDIESHHEIGGRWEQLGGRGQTRRIAESFHHWVKLDPKNDIRTMLDIGCGLGDGLPVWKKHYPSLLLHGCDVTDSSLAQCQRRFGSIAKFFRAGFEELSSHFDTIYCSHVLEHFEQHVEIAEHLTTKCRVLYIVTPYNELREGRLERPEDGDWHVATMHTDTFTPLLRSGAAVSIETVIVPFPRRFGRRAARVTLEACRSLIWRTPLFQEQLQIIYTIHSKGTKA